MNKEDSVGMQDSESLVILNGDEIFVSEVLSKTCSLEHFTKSFQSVFHRKTKTMIAMKPTSVIMTA